MTLARNALGLPNRLCTPDRETLERVILPAYAARAEIQTVLFVGCDWCTRHYERLFAGRFYWTIDPNPWKKRFGGRHHLVDGLERLDTHFEPGGIDLIVCNGVVGYGLNGQAECERAFTGCFDALRANGEPVLGWNDVPEHRPEVASTTFRRLPVSRPSGLMRWARPSIWLTRPIGTCSTSTSSPALLRRVEARERDHMWSIITCPKPEHETCVAPSIKRAKS